MQYFRVLCYKCLENEYSNPSEIERRTHRMFTYEQKAEQTPTICGVCGSSHIDVWQLVIEWQRS